MGTLFGPLAAPLEEPGCVYTILITSIVISSFCYYHELIVYYCCCCCCGDYCDYCHCEFLGTLKGTPVEPLLWPILMCKEDMRGCRAAARISFTSLECRVLGHFRVLGFRVLGCRALGS